MYSENLMQTKLSEERGGGGGLEICALLYPPEHLASAQHSKIISSRK